MRWRKRQGRSLRETTRNEWEETRRVEDDISGRDAEGADEPDNPIDEAVETPWWREAGETADWKRCGMLWKVGTTAVLKVDARGIQCEALFDMGASRSFI